MLLSDSDFADTWSRMASGIAKSDRSVQWAERSVSSAGSPPGPRQHSSYAVIVEEDANAQQEGPPSAPPDAITGTLQNVASPSPMTPGQAMNIPSPVPHHDSGQRARANQSAPAEMGPPHKPISKATNKPAGETLDIPSRLAMMHLGAPPDPQQAVLDPTAPIRAAKKPELLDAPVTEDELKRRAENEGSSLAKAIGQEPDQPQSTRNDSWGTPFRVQWIRTERLPFARLKRLRNPWNYDREVKISRDGIELEPNTGEALLREWDRMEAEKRDFQKVLGQHWVQRDGKWVNTEPGTGSSSNNTAR